ncbi:ribosome maturation factor RimP [Candidatus Vallotia lariciata]|uniref:ribosome maturation factor RimP n=1 Tax=Candidatus Vallotia laricis TaxID=2018052 RepID=UPI001D0083E6|nr:ribosome maturation factor RimP [Candidatus Vallotia lariciata]UDG83079.1 Ribosome maturation factor RimP [Candidatus Vallotia lariciata]
MQLSELVKNSVTGLGYEFVDLERSRRGILRVFIDHPAGISINDCQKVTRQLQRELTVENIEYQRLEVSSPGLDRPLKNRADFLRFAGNKAMVILKHPLDHKKSFCGILHAPNGDIISLEVQEKDGSIMLDFNLADLDRVRLVPQVDFRSRK